jgi:uncharacterized phage-associated protein
MQGETRDHTDPATKLVQAASVLVQAHEHRRVEYLRLLKLLYIAMREALHERGHFMFRDRVFAMKHGPVLSSTYDAIRMPPAGSLWAKTFRTKHYEIELAAGQDPGTGLLSRYELAKLREVAGRYADVDTFDLADLTHEYPEWSAAWRAKGTSNAVEISWQAVGEAVGMSAEDVRAALDAEAFRTALPTDSPGGNSGAAA